MPVGATWVDPLSLDALPPLPQLDLAVVGHVEMVSFLSVDRLPAAGQIAHASTCFDHAAGGGAVVAVQLARLSGRRVAFFTALGRDQAGHQAVEELEALGLDLHVAWREAPTRRGITFIDATGERTITVIGERLAPAASDPLPWPILAGMEGVFVTASDAEGLRLARQAGVLAATPRVRLPVLRQAAVKLDALIGSASDPGERYESEDLNPPPRWYVGTEGAKGGFVRPGGRFSALERTSAVRDAYGAGDCFAAGVTAGMAAGWELREAISLGCHCGNACLNGHGPYQSQLTRQQIPTLLR
jgi:ribokinase